MLGKLADKETGESMRYVTVLGGTGSIGKQALDVLSAHPDRFALFGISGGENTQGLIARCRAYRPRFAASRLPLDASLLPQGTELLCGENAAAELAAMPESDTVVNGISGIAALTPLLAALRLGKRVALANKESIVCGHALVDEALDLYGGELLPVDSEQSAIFQALSCGAHGEIDKVYLTASGGPFWKRPLDELEHVTPEEALKHPTWRMGGKITIDSATLFNKGLEVLEAAYLFHIPGEKIEVVLHPQSVVHSAVGFADGTIMANCSAPDMRLPIQYALTYPERLSCPARRLTLSDLAGLQFCRAELARFTALRLAYDALAAGGSAPVVYNGANEAAVSLFFGGKLGFLGIERAVSYALERHTPRETPSLDAILDADWEARRLVEAYASAQE